jgi:hypothetical protein
LRHYKTRFLAAQTVDLIRVWGGGGRITVEPGYSESVKRKNFFEKNKSCVIIQGFADHSEVGKKAAKAAGWIIKNIQPISVGV